MEEVWFSVHNTEYLLTAGSRLDGNGDEHRTIVAEL